jgi:hypothetical protein
VILFIFCSHSSSLFFFGVPCITPPRFTGNHLEQIGWDTRGINSRLVEVCPLIMTANSFAESGLALLLVFIRAR